MGNRNDTEIISLEQLILESPLGEEMIEEEIRKRNTQNITQSQQNTTPTVVVEEPQTQPEPEELKIVQATIINNTLTEITFNDNTTLITDLKPIMQQKEHNIYKEENFPTLHVTDKGSLGWDNGTILTAETLKNTSPNPKNSKVNVTLTPDPENTDNYIIIIENIHTEPVSLIKPKASINNTIFDGAYFETYPKQKQTKRYPKPKEYLNKDIIELKPGKKITSSTINIEELYTIDNTTEPIYIRYKTTHPLNQKNNTTITSNWVKIDNNTVQNENQLEENLSPESFSEEPSTEEPLIQNPITETHPHQEDNLTYLWEKEIESGKNPKIWSVITLITTIISLTGIILWFIPSSIFSLFGIITASVSLKRKEGNKGLLITSIIVNSIIFIFAILLIIIFALIIGLIQNIVIQV